MLSIEPSRAGDRRECRPDRDRHHVPGQQVQVLIDGTRDPHRRSGEEEGRRAGVCPCDGPSSGAPRRTATKSAVHGIAEKPSMQSTH